MVAITVVISGCSGDDTDGLPGDTTTQESPPIETTTTALPQLERHDAGFALPVTLVAGDVRFDLTTVEFSNATPGTYFDDEPDLLEDDLLYVAFTVQVDPAAGAGVAHEWPAKNFQIVTGSGRVVSGSAVDYAASISATSGEPTPAAVVFPVDEREMAGARFRLDDGTNPPVEVTLTAPAAAG